MLSLTGATAFPRVVLPFLLGPKYGNDLMHKTLYGEPTKGFLMTLPLPPCRAVLVIWLLSLGGFWLDFWYNKNLTRTFQLVQQVLSRLVSCAKDLGVERSCGRNGRAEFCSQGSLQQNSC